MIDINSDDFAIFPPHFISTNPLQDDNIKEALYLTYPKILQTYTNTENDPTGVLLSRVTCLRNIGFHTHFKILYHTRAKAVNRCIQ